MDLQDTIFHFLYCCAQKQISVFDMEKYFIPNQIEQMDLMLRTSYLKQKKLLGLNLIKEKNKFVVVVPEDKIFINISDPDKETYKYKTLIYYFERIINHYRWGVIRNLFSYIENNLFDGQLKSDSQPKKID